MKKHVDYSLFNKIAIATFLKTTILTVKPLLLTTRSLVTKITTIDKTVTALSEWYAAFVIQTSKLIVSALYPF